VLRTQPDDVGLTTALGWYVTKHAAALWSARPPTRPFRRIDVQSAVDARPGRNAAGLVDTEATVEATAVAFERDGTPSVGIVTALDYDGRRIIANAHDVDVLRDMTVSPWEGRRAKITNDGSTNAIGN
jgi:acetyl-CoA C-acetyltransferase